MDTGLFPAYCPACRLDSQSEGEKEPSFGRIEGPALSYLQQQGVISLDFQMRFMKQQADQQAGQGDHFFRCPANCGRYLIDQDPEYCMIPRGLSDAEGYERVAKLGKCACGAHVCLLCHEMAVEKTIGNEITFEHTCPEELDREDPMDPASLELMRGFCKQCPNCNAFIEKIAGCNVMMCGTTAHGRLQDALANGGCGHLFYWDTLATANTYYIGLDGRRTEYRYAN